MVSKSELDIDFFGWGKFKASIFKVTELIKLENNSFHRVQKLQHTEFLRILNISLDVRIILKYVMNISLGSPGKVLGCNSDNCYKFPNRLLTRRMEEINMSHYPLKSRSMMTEWEYIGAQRGYHFCP